MVGSSSMFMTFIFCCCLKAALAGILSVENGTHISGDYTIVNKVYSPLSQNPQFYQNITYNVTGLDLSATITFLIGSGLEAVIID